MLILGTSLLCRLFWLVGFVYVVWVFGWVFGWVAFVVCVYFDLVVVLLLLLLF